jgi:hypothetical protein
MERLGAELIGEQEVAYFGEVPKINVVYRITDRRSRIRDRG